MTTSSNPVTEPQMSAAIAEVTNLIRESYPGAEFVVDLGEYPETVYVTAVVDVDDPDEVVECFIDRVLTLQVDEGLALHVIPIRTPARRELMLASLQSESLARIIARSAV